MPEFFDSVQEMPNRHLLRWSIVGGIVGLLIAVVAIFVWYTTTTGIDRLPIALCPAGIFFWSAQMEGSTGVLWLAITTVCVSNMLLWAGYGWAISICATAVWNRLSRFRRKY
jgi:uncharacterized membrane protein